MDAWLDARGEELLTDPDLTRQEQEELFTLLQTVPLADYVNYTHLELHHASTGKIRVFECPDHLDEWYAEQMRLISANYRITDIEAEQLKALLASVLLVDYLGHATLVLRSESGLTYRVAVPGDRPPESKEVAWPITEQPNDDDDADWSPRGR